MRPYLLRHPLALVGIAGLAYADLIYRLLLRESVRKWAKR